MDKNVVLARKYGRAIYEIAAEQNSLEKTGEELHLIADTIMGNDELKQLLPSSACEGCQERYIK